MRRRRNPDYVNLAALAAIGVGAYVLYTWLKGAGTAVATAVPAAFSATSSKVADVLEAVFPHGNTTLDPTATIVLGTGQEIPATAPSGVGSFTAADGTTQIQFYYGGKIWRTTAAVPDDTNTYYAVSNG